MNRINRAISWATGILLVYVVMAALPVHFAIVFGLFMLASVALVWMVITILKDPRPGNRTFDDYFYEDVNTRRSKES